MLSAVVTTEFDSATAVARGGENAFTATLSRDWWVVTGPNGGYVASVLLRALTERIGDPERMARSLTVHYLRAPGEGAVEIETRLIREGRSVTTMAASMTQHGAEVAVATAVFARPRPFWPFHDAEMPPVPAPEDTPASSWPPDLFPPIARRFTYRPITKETVFTGEPRAELACWLRLNEPRPLDPVLLATLADAAAPAVFPKATAPVAATTIDLTVHFRAPADMAPYDGWAMSAFRSRVSVDGFVEEDGELWTPDGRLIAQSRQLALLMPVS
jgi:acyl-CoA thioesterase